MAEKKADQTQDKAQETTVQVDPQVEIERIIGAMEKKIEQDKLKTRSTALSDIDKNFLSAVEKLKALAGPKE